MKVENGPHKPKRPRLKRPQWKKKTRPKRPQLTSKTARYVTLYNFNVAFQRRFGRCRMPIMTRGRFGCRCGPFWTLLWAVLVVWWAVLDKFLGIKIFGAVLAMGRFGIVPKNWYVQNKSANQNAPDCNHIAQTLNTYTPVYTPVRHKFILKPLLLLLGSTMGTDSRQCKTIRSTAAISGTSWTLSCLLRFGLRST